MSLKPLTLICLLALLLSACGDESKSWSKVKETSGASWDAVKTWSAEKSSAAKQALEKKLDDLAPQLLIARAAAKQGGAAASRELEQAVTNSKAAFEVLKSAGADRWADALVAFKQAYEVLSAKIKSLTS